MTGLPENNYPAFFAAEEALRAVGHDPINPARAEGREGCTTWADYMRASLRDLADAEGLAMLPGYVKSRGATLEFDIACALGIPAMEFRHWCQEWTVQ